MCELTFVNLHNDLLNRTYLYLQMLQNSTKHKDGFGIYTKEKGIYKSEASFADVVNQQEFLKQLVNTNEPIMGHTRFATGIHGKIKVISEENSHPFETDKLVLMHNGVVEYRDKKDYEKYKDITVDSLLFLLELSEIYDGKNFCAAIRKTLEKFYGVFCFLIYSKLENRWFAVRGNKRFLHYTSILENGKEVGYVVNTELEDMRKVVKSFCTVATLMTGNTYTKEKTDWITTAETIYELTDKSVRNLGIVQEKEKPIYVAESFPAIKKDSPISILAEFMLATNIHLVELDQMLLSLYGEGLLNVSGDNMTAFIKCLPTFKRSYSNKKRRVWEKISQVFEYYLLDAYSSTGLQCPFFLNTKQELITAFNKAKRDLSDKQREYIGEVEEDIILGVEVEEEGE